MSLPPDTHIEPSRHSTDEVDEKLRRTEDIVDGLPGAGSPAIKPISDPPDDIPPPDDELPAPPA